MLRKIISLVMAAMFICSSMGLAFAGNAADMALLEKLSVVEKMTYGAEQTGAIVERVGKQERELWGKETTGSLLSRVDKMYIYYRISGDSSPSLLLKLNAAEWLMTRSVTTLPIKIRLENLERMLQGNVATGALDERLNTLVKYAYSNGKVTIANVTVNKDNLLKIKILKAISARSSRVGDIVPFQVADDIYVDGSLIIAKGSQGYGKVTKVEESKNFGRDAEVQISFDTVESIDGTVIKTVLGEKAKEENKSMATAAGASLAGMMILGPIGIVGGAFVQGKSVEIPAGTEIYIQIKEAVTLYGI